VPTELLPLAPGVHGLLARRADAQWLVYYAYGERRGLIGNGPFSWGLALFDGVLGRPNDYYRLFVMSRVPGLDAASTQPLIDLSGKLLPRIAAWYAD
jgi:hypothetical protein